MKKIFITLLAAMLLPVLLCLAACEETNETEVQALVIDKYTETQYDHISSWFWEQPIYKTHYFLSVLYEETNREIEVTRTEYGRYSIGDNYTIKIKSEAAKQTEAAK